MNQRYLNFSNHLVVSPLTRLLQIELNNNTYFPFNFKHTSKASMNISFYQIDTSAFVEYKCNLNLPSVATLVDASSNDILLIETAIAYNPKTTMHRSAGLSDDLCFIQYTHDKMLRCLCYIIQIDTESILHANAYYASNHIYILVRISCYTSCS